MLRARGLAAPALLLWVVAPTGCDRTAPSIPAPPPSEAAVPPGEFASHRELWNAVRSGDYAERVELPVQELAAPPLPEPVEVPFESGTRPPEDALGALDALVARLGEDERIGVDLIGCSDPSGPADLNRRISQQRAEAVADALRERGLADERIDEVVGRGEDCPEQERKVNVVPERSEA